MTRSKLLEQAKFIACGNTYFAKETAETAVVITSTSGKKIQTSATSGGDYVDFAELAEGVNYLNIAGAKAYLKTNDSGAVAVLGDFATDPVSLS